LAHPEILAPQSLHAVLLTGSPSTLRLCSYSPVHTIAEKCDSRRFLRQSHFSATVWTGLISCVLLTRRSHGDPMVSISSFHPAGS